MNLRALNIFNVVDTALTEPITVVEEVQRIIDSDEYEIPSEVISAENVLRVQALTAYYSNNHSYLLGLWGALRVSAKTNRDLIAMRDYIEGACSSCKQKYESASRQLTAYQELRQDSSMKERPIYK